MGVPASPFARSIGAFTACLVVGMLVCVAIYLLRAVDFAPLRSLVSFEDRLYAKFAPPSLQLQTRFHPIIFVDIDDETVRRWGAPHGAAGRTPRALIAGLTRVVRQARASVVFLDYDLRDHLPDDVALSEELAKPSLTPVLLPKFFSSGVLPSCESQTESRMPTELETTFDGTIKAGSVGSVHSVVALGAYGLVDGTCSFYRVGVGDGGEAVSRQAAMLRAIEIAEPQLKLDGSANERDTPHVIQARWWIQGDTEVLRDQHGKLAYARVKVGSYVHQNTIETDGVDLSAFGGAIVIISSTHLQSDDDHVTPVGELPGALIHANLGLELQSLPAEEIPLRLQFTVDIALIVIASILTIPLCWYPTYINLPPDGRISFRRRVSRLTREGIVILIFGVAVSASFLFLLRVFGDCLEGWRFGMLSFGLGAIVVLLIEVVAAVAGAAAELAETGISRISCRPSDLSEGKPPCDQA